MFDTDAILLTLGDFKELDGPKKEAYLRFRHAYGLSPANAFVVNALSQGDSLSAGEMFRRNLLNRWVFALYVADGVESDKSSLGQISAFLQENGDPKNVTFISIEPGLSNSPYPWVWKQKSDTAGLPHYLTLKRAAQVARVLSGDCQVFLYGSAARALLRPELKIGAKDLNFCLVCKQAAAWIEQKLADLQAHLDDPTYSFGSTALLQLNDFLAGQGPLEIPAKVAEEIRKILDGPSHSDAGNCLASGELPSIVVPATFTFWPVSPKSLILEGFSYLWPDYYYIESIYADAVSWISAWDRFEFYVLPGYTLLDGTLRWQFIPGKTSMFLPLTVEARKAYFARPSM